MLASNTPLAGTRVVEIAGLAPGPFAGLILADYGAEVVRIDRAGNENRDQLASRKKSVVLDLKSPAGKDVLFKLVQQADVLIEPFRPGVMEKLGFGPDGGV
jgi:alpha-methylacyl-CoA racemase